MPLASICQKQQWSRHMVRSLFLPIPHDLPFHLLTSILLHRHRNKGRRSYRSRGNRALLRTERCLHGSGLYRSLTITTVDANRYQSKPNLGHSEGAAAITGILKAVVSLENRTILPNIKFNNPNPRSMSLFDLISKASIAMLTVISPMG
jgi:hypothetical protein